MKKKLSVASLIVVVIVLGFLRDYVFVTVNKIIEGGGDVSGKLSMLKWVMTFLFSLLYLLITCVFIQLLFQSRKYIAIAILAYVSLFLVSFFAVLLGYFFSSFENVYSFVRMVMGIAQSPIVMMILIAASYLNEKITGRQT